MLLSVIQLRHVRCEETRDLRRPNLRVQPTDAIQLTTIDFWAALPNAFHARFSVP